ncbi:MAG: redox-regulated ATPase YchF [Candidatus Taylorbacteria bacterium]|nr:redox-regulated ATPase YchF [Candidatus Taylorbacteria bacterium]
MSLSIGIVGLPNVGKSTLFNALTKKSVPAENYPFCTIDPSVGVVAVPDERLWRLSAFSHSAKTVPGAVEFVDIAGLVKGASEGEGLGNQFLSNIRETDAIAEVVRIFEDDKVIHVDGKVNPLSDIEVINLELILADLQTVSKRLGNLARDIKRGVKEAVEEGQVLERVKGALENGKLASSVVLEAKEKPYVRSMHLITSKAILYVLNKKAGGTNLDELNDERFQKLMEFLKNENASWVIVDAGIEHDLKDFEGEEKEQMRSDLGVKDDGINDLIKKGYETLNLITYFTTGEDETRAWTIGKGWTAPEAGTAIHGDFKDKFVRAEIIMWDTLLTAGSYANAREKGLIRTEGKEYIVKDGDTIEFKI